jgi:hypothetical protein
LRTHSDTIEHDQPALLLLEPVERPLAVNDRMDLITFGPQVVDDSRGEKRVVFNDQYPVEELRRSVHVGPAGATGHASTN